MSHGFKNSWLCHVTFSFAPDTQLTPLTDQTALSSLTALFVLASVAAQAPLTAATSLAALSAIAAVTAPYPLYVLAAPELVSMLQLHEQSSVSISQNNIDTYLPGTRGFVFTRQNSCTIIIIIIWGVLFWRGEEIIEGLG